MNNTIASVKYTYKICEFKFLLEENKLKAVFS